MNMKSFMQSIIVALIGIFISVNAYSQTAPAAVTEAFNKKFPDAVSVKWDKENSQEYEASFKMNGIKYSASFSDKGQWLETETGTTFDKLPAKVQDVFKTTHKNSKVKAAALIETSQGMRKYEVEYKKGKKTMELFYDENGNTVK